VMVNFGEMDEYPVFEFPETKSLEDRKTLADIYNSAKSLGDIDLEEASTELGITITEREEPEPQPLPVPTDEDDKLDADEVAEKVMNRLKKIIAFNKMDSESEEFLEGLFDEV